MKTRCDWCLSDPLYISYHDEEWGVPVNDDRLLFEFVILEGAQAGLSWLTILRRREGYRKAFAGFDVKKVSKFTPEKCAELLGDTSIIRNRLKIASAVSNAKAFLDVQKECGTFSRYMWSFVGGKPIQYERKTLKDIPAVTPEAEKISKDLKKRGFRFVGPTIIYAHMQATGMVNDHLVSCHRHAPVRKLGAKFAA